MRHCSTLFFGAAKSECSVLWPSLAARTRFDIMMKATMLKILLGAALCMQFASCQFRKVLFMDARKKLDLHRTASSGYDGQGNRIYAPVTKGSDSAIGFYLSLSVALVLYISACW